MMGRVSLVFLAALLLRLSAPGPLSAQPQPATLTEALAAGDLPLTTLAQAFQAADPQLLALLADPDARWTLIAPVDGSFISAGFPDPAFRLTAEQMMADPALLNALLRYHLIPTALTSGDFFLRSVFAGTLLPDAWVQISGEDEGVRVGGARIAQEIQTGNGTLWLVDRLLLPLAFGTERFDPVASLAELPRYPLAEGEATSEEATAEATAEAALPPLLEALAADESLRRTLDVLAADDALAARLAGGGVYTVLAVPDSAWGEADPAASALVLAGLNTPEIVLSRILPFREGLAWSLLRLDGAASVDALHQGGALLIGGAPVLRTIPAANGLVIVLGALPAAPGS